MLESASTQNPCLGPGPFPRPPVSLTLWGLRPCPPLREFSPVPFRSVSLHCSCVPFGQKSSLPDFLRPGQSQSTRIGIPWRGKGGGGGFTWLGSGGDTFSDATRKVLLFKKCKAMSERKALQ